MSLNDSHTHALGGGGGGGGGGGESLGTVLQCVCITQTQLASLGVKVASIGCSFPGFPLPRIILYDWVQI